MVLFVAGHLEAEEEILTLALRFKICMFLKAMNRSYFESKFSAVVLGIRINHSQIWEGDEFLLHGKIPLGCDKCWLSACLIVDINDDLSDIHGVSDDGIYFI